VEFAGDKAKDAELSALFVSPVTIFTIQRCAATDEITDYAMALMSYDALLNSAKQPERR